ncbi:cell division cycle protein 123 homolog [Daphnia pulicaria]|uniref:cell division cycle protein 123 homolog n=1 Tax=Daphnia pulicaria TaxID=35523 RepID=UPI001EEA5885|nr:cell division cycle protein 123 homolog [Daphnia pulicaria]
MKSHEIQACSFSEWYPLFKKVTFPSKIIPLTQEFVDYLLADNLVLRSDQALLTYSRDDSNSSDSEDDEEGWAKAESETPALEAPHFEDIDKEITTAIAEFGGKAFIKLNWSSPKDAAWIALNNSLQCHMSADVHLLLKSSDFILHDLTEPFKECEDQNVNQTPVKYNLVLRKWVEINPVNEFRCFVQNKNLIGISQRDDTQFSPFIEKEKEDIVRDIVSFFKEQIRPKFHLDNYVMDVFRQRKDKIVLIDFNPYGVITDSLLFDWNEDLLQISDASETTSPSDCASATPDFRFIPEESGIRSNPLRRYCVPEDIAHLTSGEDPFKLMDLLKLRSGTQEDNADSD